MGASQRAAKGATDYAVGRGEAKNSRFSDIKNSDVKLVGLGWREGAAKVSSRAAVGIISDSLYPFENENAPLGELTAAPHPREVAGVSLARGPRVARNEDNVTQPSPRSSFSSCGKLAPAAGPPYVRSRCGLDTRRRPPRFIPLR